MTFRVHYADGDKIDVEAASPMEARKAAQAQRSGPITKIKRVKS